MQKIFMGNDRFKATILFAVAFSTFFFASCGNTESPANSPELNIPESDKPESDKPAGGGGVDENHCQQVNRTGYPASLSPQQAEICGCGGNEASLGILSSLLYVQVVPALSAVLSPLPVH
jgi:hypothetical protein